MIDGRKCFNQPVKNNLQLVKEMITQLIVYRIIPISKIIVR